MEDTKQQTQTLLGKFENTEALVKAYEQLEEELSRRNQTIEQYENAERARNERSEEHTSELQSQR